MERHLGTGVSGARQGGISMLTVWLWATNNGPFADLVNGRQDEAIGTFFEGLYNHLQSLSYHAELRTSFSPLAELRRSRKPQAFRKTRKSEGCPNFETTKAISAAARNGS
jgi:hypothetical protein